MSENNDLNRLKRAGDEASETNKKLIEAAQRVADLIARVFANVGPFVEARVELGRKYGILSDSRAACGFYLELQSQNLYVRFLPGQAGRAAALRLADDLAGGWLKELQEMLDKYHEKSNEALAALDSSGDKLERKSADNKPPVELGSGGYKLN